MKHSNEQRHEMAADCYVLLLLLADVQEQQARADGSEEGFQRALRVLEAAPRLGFDTRAYHQRRARLLKETGKMEQAKQEQAIADAALPSGALDYFLLGEEQYRQDRTEDALVSLNRALANEPSNFWAQFLVGACHLKAERWEAAKASLTACLGQCADFVWAYLLRSFAHEQLQEFTNAEVDFQRALELNPNKD